MRAGRVGSEVELDVARAVLVYIDHRHIGLGSIVQEVDGVAEGVAQVGNVGGGSHLLARMESAGEGQVVDHILGCARHAVQHIDASVLGYGHLDKVEVTALAHLPVIGFERAPDGTQEVSAVAHLGPKL